MLKAIIVEDEVGSRNNLKNILKEYCKEITVIGEADSIASGLRLLKDDKLSPDVAFLDISLPDGLIFQLFSQIDKITFDIIFVTAYDKYAIKACEFSCIGYILKPIDPDLLREAVERIKYGKENQVSKRIEIFKQSFGGNSSFDKISISAVDGIYFLNLSDIIRFEGDDNYTHIYTKSNERITVSKTIKLYDDLLSNQGFYRVHKKFLININYLQKFVKGDNGYVIMSDGAQVEVSRRKRPLFSEYLKGIQEEI